MDRGMQNRLAQRIQPDGHCLFLPIGHRYFQVPTRRLERPGETIAPLLPYRGAVSVNRGVLRSSINPALLNLAKMVDKGENYGIPVTAITAVGMTIGTKVDTDRDVFEFVHNGTSVAQAQ